MKIGLAGLGKMGSQVARKLLAGGHELVVDSRKPENTQPLIELGAQSFSDYHDLIGQLGEAPIIWLMIPHAKVPAEVQKLLEILPPFSVIVDGGNSRYTSTMELQLQAEKQGVQIVDVGTSGGVWGMENGFSLMVGGDGPTVERLSPLFDELAKPNGAWHHFGATGAGHYVKMVHNATEYGLMQAYAEGYRLLKEGPLENIDLVKVAEVWQRGSINQSFLNGLIEDMLKHDHNLEAVEGRVAESGETKWALETAHDADIPLPVIQNAFDVRLESQKGNINYATKFLAQLRNEFGGHDVNPEQTE